MGRENADNIEVEVKRIYHRKYNLYFMIINEYS